MSETTYSAQVQAQAQWYRGIAASYRTYGLRFSPGTQGREANNNKATEYEHMADNLEARVSANALIVGKDDE